MILPISDGRLTWAPDLSWEHAGADQLDKEDHGFPTLGFAEEGGERVLTVNWEEEFRLRCREGR
jgi:hypothetical protein